MWGGKREGGETAIEAALRETEEETGYRGPSEVSHLHRLDTRTFAYDSFLMVVEDEFEPRPCVEWADWKWVALEEVPSPMHWGLAELLSDRTAAALLVKAVENMSGRPCRFAPPQQRSQDRESFERAHERG